MLGKIIGIRQVHISDIETGKHKPTLQQAAHMRNLQKWQDGDEFPNINMQGKGI